MKIRFIMTTVTYELNSFLEGTRLKDAEARLLRLQRRSSVRLLACSSLRRWSLRRPASRPLPALLQEVSGFGHPHLLPLTLPTTTVYRSLPAISPLPYYSSSPLVAMGIIFLLSFDRFFPLFPPFISFSFPLRRCSHSSPSSKCPH